MTVKDFSPIDAMGLPALEGRIKEDLAFLCYPGKAWVPQREGVTDVVIIGGGMCGMVAWLGLATGGIQNVRVLDRAETGREGPWLSYARMETLRSPKVLTGPAFGHGALTFQAWYRAQFGIKGAETPTILTRKLIFATGRDGTGGPNIPDFIKHLPGHLWAHSADEIDFTRLAGKRVAVIGVGASAVDNAAEALEHGAAEVRHLIRRKEMPRINKMMGIGSFGFTAGFADLPDEDGTFYEADFVILGTGFVIDPMARREFGDTAGDILLWQDVYTPPQDEKSGDLGRFPYLNPDFTFREKQPGTAPWLANVYCFNYGASASLGKVSGDIPGISEGAAWLSRAVAAKLYAEDIDAHWEDMQAYDTPELKGDEWEATPLDAHPEPQKGRVA